MEIDREIESLLFELGEIEAELRRRDPRRHEIGVPPAVTLADVQSLLDDETLLLEYALGPERGHLWAISRRGLRVAELADEATLEDLVRRFHGELSTVTAGGGRADGLGAELTRLLLTPVAAEVAAHARQLIVPDGALHYLPFAALPRPSPAGEDEPLLVRHEVVHLPSAAALLYQRRSGSPENARAGMRAAPW